MLFRIFASLFLPSAKYGPHTSTMWPVYVTRIIVFNRGRCLCIEQLWRWNLYLLLFCMRKYKCHLRLKSVLYLFQVASQQKFSYGFWRSLHEVYDLILFFSNNIEEIIRNFHWKNKSKNSFYKMCSSIFFLYSKKTGNIIIKVEEIHELTN